MVLHIIWMIVIGLVVGAIARLLVPGRQPLGWIATALLAVSAMNGAIYDSTWNVFFKLRHAKTYQTMLSTKLGPLDVALGEIAMALLRGLIRDEAIRTTAPLGP